MCGGSGLVIDAAPSFLGGVVVCGQVIFGVPALAGGCLVSCVGCFGLLGSGVPVDIYGEFDSGSGRTLAACLTHASRTESALRSDSSGERVSNTWVICPALWDKPGKLGLIPDRTTNRMVCGGKLLRCGMGPRPISLLVG